ncbi:unnamed protein product [Ascophyllum nodosum]
MELLETAYPEVVFDSPDPRPLLLAALEVEHPPSPRQHGSSRCDAVSKGTLHDGGFIPRVCFRCPLSPGHGQLRVLLPRRYPEDPLVATVEGTPQLSALTREAISVAAQAEAQRLSGEARLEPHCLQVLGEALRVSAEHADATTGTAAAPKTASVETRKYGSGRDCSLVSEDSSTTRRLRGKLGDHPSKEGHPLEIHRYRGAGGHLEDEAHGGRESTAVVLLGRRLIYSHHIIAPQKRTGIMRAARELDLGGFSKVGWPGVIVVEGHESSCQEFVKILRGWRWKHLAVRGEETLPVPREHSLDEQRLLPRPLEELGEKEGVSAVAARCREAGLGDLFSTLLR